MLATGSNTLGGQRLSIRLGADGFSFSVVNVAGGQVVQTDAYPVSPTQTDALDVLRQALEKPYLMDYRFQSVELICDSPATIVPLEHFNKGDMLALYKLAFPSEPSSTSDMHYQLLSPVEAVMVFRLDQDILRTVQECYPDVKVCCADAVLLEDFAEQQGKRLVPDEAEQRDVYVSVAERRMFVAVFRRSKLLYAASQPATGDADRLFLLLGIWNALELQPQRDLLHLHGASKDLRKTVEEYLLNVK